MNSIWGAELHYTPDYWPQWLALAAALVVALLVGLALHGALRYALAPKNAPGVPVRLYLYSAAVRCWHWSNALLFVLLLLSGLCGHFSLGPVAQWVALHTLCGYVLIVAWVGFVLINLLSGNGRHYRVRWRGLISRCLRQARFYLFGIMKGEVHPFVADARGKFNPLQQLAYLAIMYALVPLLMVSGLLCLYPQFSAGQAPLMLTLHMVLAVVALMFLCAHLYLCTLGDTPGQIFRSMLDGYHRHRAHESAPDARP
ncbi:thiosulfate reductase cytochrome B subunit [Edwardsiella piscicida]|uniref:Thiosulfate reductase cytochrome B subunit n=4 Tax=Edwardsiella TaxID=635 RepID=A0A0H3DR07_EDWTF|nr:thiosulfate reductase cytochrome B subunit [Edwardsiella piscicida]ACY84680.1 thiosulfate reductase cytochrome B subunit [Edwardsiella tarda EIB202]ADM41771.1 Thiosulfate reductase cytochrome B subunit [Edwardsiella tarda FL6-60]AFJ42492.1 thiosulfate reductase cytochrome B subunit [Edwardsiella tarda]MDM3863446.1 thiosulfate reductase cytochrome B subunit [Edwardsiella piscicida]QBB13979.1 thiosulfate reductase cytochrome B subunit [Edwardsiella piscicida]